MKKQFTIFIKNMLKLIGIMYISISLKNVLQILLGTIFKAEHDIKIYKLINLRNPVYTLDFVLRLLLIYDFVIFVTIAYFWIYLILYLVISMIGNKVWFHISYITVIYLLTILFFDHFHPNILFIAISIFLGYANWRMFKKWIRFD